MLYTLPWVEKYRPININNIILSENNRTILDNIIKLNNFPNLLLYGPPGTGKTTTIIRLIELWQKNNNQYNKSLSIHLNASDERGIDIVRNNITQFIKMEGLFIKGTKFVILDEVDYMTKNAQIALKYLLQSENNVRFCLICNYISKIDNCLQRYFVKLKFNNLPPENINALLKNILKKEHLFIEDNIINGIQKEFNNDIRSAINYIQCNYSILKNIIMLNDDFFIELTEFLKDKSMSINHIKKFIDKKISEFNITYTKFIDLYCKYALNNITITNELLQIIDKVTNNNLDYDYIIPFFIVQFRDLLL